jgi:hypothetical protein
MTQSGHGGQPPCPTRQTFSMLLWKIVVGRRHDH